MTDASTDPESVARGGRFGNESPAFTFPGVSGRWLGVVLQRTWC